MHAGWPRDKAVSVMESELILLTLLTQAIREQQALRVKSSAWQNINKAALRVALFKRDDNIKT